MKPKAYALSFVALLLTAGSASADYCINKDVQKIGPGTPYDLAIEITGTQAITWRYDGLASLNTLFSTFTNTPSSGGLSEVLHWSNLMGTNQPVLGAPKKYHIGWCTVKPNNVVDMYWTNKAGGRIPGSRVCQTGAHSSNSPIPGVQWGNHMNVAMDVGNVQFALSRTAWNLADLNGDNDVLARQLAPLPGGELLRLEERGEDVQLQVPGAVAGDWVVLVYDVSCPTSQAVVRDFVQFQL